MKFLIVLLPAAIAIIGLLPIKVIFSIWRTRECRNLRESPLTGNLLRPPGYSLRQKVDDLNIDIVSYLVAIVMIPLLVFVVHVSQSYFAGESESFLRITMSVFLGLVLTSLAGWRLSRLLAERKNYVLGLEGELATGEELNQLMLDGCRVFHDIPFPFGNIDHVVVSPSGVFSVNSKTLCKPKSGDGKAEVTVDHQRNLIRFPDHESRIPIEQLETEGNWLSQKLSSSVGRSITVEPILALPGWYVKERIGRGSVYVINPRNPQKFFVQDRKLLSPELVQQVAHQLEQMCRDVEPSYREKRERWEARA